MWFETVLKKERTTNNARNGSKQQQRLCFFAPSLSPCFAPLVSFRLVPCSAFIRPWLWNSKRRAEMDIDSLLDDVEQLLGSGESEERNKARKQKNKGRSNSNPPAPLSQTTTTTPSSSASSSSSPSLPAVLKTQASAPAIDGHRRHLLASRDADTASAPGSSFQIQTLVNGTQSRHRHKQTSKPSATHAHDDIDSLLTDLESTVTVSQGTVLVCLCVLVLVACVSVSVCACVCNLCACIYGVCLCACYSVCLLEKNTGGDK